MGRPPIHHPDRPSTSTERQRATRKRTKELGGTSLAIRLEPEEAEALRYLQSISGYSARDVLGSLLLISQKDSKKREEMEKALD